MTEEKAPSDRLYDEGCPFCGGPISGYMRAGTADGEKGYCTKHKGESWYGYAGPEYDRRKALRSPPSPPSEGEFYGTMPAELPETLPAGTRYGGNPGGGMAVSELRLRGNIYHGKFSTDDGAPCPGEQCGARFIDWATVRRLSAPSADKWEPRLGQEVEGFHEHSGAMVRGTYGGPDVFKSPLRNGQPAALIIMPGNTTGGWLVPPETVRPATPSPKAAPVERKDPYSHKHGLTDAEAAETMRARERAACRIPNAHDLRVAAARLAREARYERRKAETVEAFDRPLATVAVGGRFGRRVPLPGRWALAEDDEP